MKQSNKQLIKILKEAIKEIEKLGEKRKAYVVIIQYRSVTKKYECDLHVEVN